MRLLFFFLIIPIGMCFGQSNLQKLRNNFKKDTSLVRQLNEIGDKFYDEKNYTKAIEQYQKALEKAQKVGSKRGMMLSHSNLASAYRLLGEYDKSIENHQKTIQYAQAENEETQLAKSYINLGNVYRNISSYKDALEVYLKGLEYAIKIKNTRFQSIALNNIGEIYRLLQQDENALLYYEKSLQLAKEIQNENQIATSLTNIASVSFKLDKRLKSLELADEAEKLSLKINNKRLLLINYITKANVYSLNKDYTEAQSYFEKALALARENKDIREEALIIGNIGRNYIESENYDKAYPIEHQGLSMAKKYNFKDLMVDRFQDLIRIHTAQKNIDSVKYYLNEYRKTFNELNNEANAKEIAKLQNTFEFRQKLQENELLRKENRLKELEIKEKQLLNEKNQKEKEILASQNALLENQNALQKSEIEKQKLLENEIRLKAEKEKQEKELLQKEALLKNEEIENQRKIALVLAVIAFLIAVLAVVLVVAYRQRQKANRLLQLKNVEINQQKEEISAQRDLLHQQNKLLAYERKNTLDSIRYAKNIQQALLPSPKGLEKYFDEFVIFYHPKDIVSGDFYYFSQKDELLFVAVADCTGHGVPGAFMSSLGIATLDNLIITKSITSPDAILYNLDATIREALHQKETGNQDGMDIALCVIDKSQQTIRIATANNGVFLKIDGEFAEVLPSKNGIGGLITEKEKIFDLHTFTYKQECQIYLYSDGFQDQFGGEKDKKFSKKRFRELIQQITDLPKEQKLRKIKETFEQWKGSNEQTDDVTILGVYLRAT